MESNSQREARYRAIGADAIKERIRDKGGLQAGDLDWNPDPSNHLANPEKYRLDVKVGDQLLRFHLQAQIISDYPTDPRVESFIDMVVDGINKNR